MTTPVLEGEDSSVTFSPGPCSRYKWQCSGPEPCDSCKKHDGEVKTLEDWDFSSSPPLHPHCRCKLVLVELVLAPSSGVSDDSELYNNMTGNPLIILSMPVNVITLHGPDIDGSRTDLAITPPPPAPTPEEMRNGGVKIWDQQ